MSELIIRPVASAEIPAAAGLLRFLNTDKSVELLATRLRRIIDDHPNYLPIAAFHDDRMVGFIGTWVATRIWCGRYLEADNFVVHPEVRRGGIGTRLMAYLEDMAHQHGCDVMAVDTYTGLHHAHRLYHRLGYEILGFHFIKSLKNA